jgi:DNA-binding Lrp family transcriptional regulator
MIELDKADLAILSMLQEDCRTPLDLIADQVGVSNHCSKANQTIAR